MLLGLSAFYHDSAAAIIDDDGQIIAAISEERLSRIKGDPHFPAEAVDACLDIAGITKADLRAVVFYEKPILKLHRVLTTLATTAPFSLRQALQALPVLVRERLWTDHELQRNFPDTEVLYARHHESHAASAFYPSPFDEAAILTIDGVGEWTCLTIGSGEGHRLRVQYQQRFPHSLGLLYSAFTAYLGFQVNEGEYKVMGLAPYGEPRFADTIREHLVDVAEDGSFRLDMRYFDFHRRLRMTGPQFWALFGGPPRKPDEPVQQHHKDLAASLQVVTEELIFGLAQAAQKLTGKRNLCMAGGVALNSVANGKLQRAGIFDEVWVQPAAGDAGGSIGAALYAHHQWLGNERKVLTPDGMGNAALGREWSAEEMEAALHLLEDENVTTTRIEDEQALLDRTAEMLDAGKIIGWFQGRSEFGPRALGRRSILADPRDSGMKDRVNASVKYREAFRPFAPAVPEESASDWFDLKGRPSPYMLFVVPVLQPEKLGAITHVDGSARVQTVRREENSRYYGVLRAFEARTGVPVLMNTSFNIKGEPIVDSPEDAVRCFLGTGIDALVMGDWVVEKG